MNEENLKNYIKGQIIFTVGLIWLDPSIDFFLIMLLAGFQEAYFYYKTKKPTPQILDFFFDISGALLFYVAILLRKGHG
jgi:hypothetical protein